MRRSSAPASGPRSLHGRPRTPAGTSGLAPSAIFLPGSHQLAIAIAAVEMAHQFRHRRTRPTWAYASSSKTIWNIDMQSIRCSGGSFDQNLENPIHQFCRRCWKKCKVHGSMSCVINTALLQQHGMISSAIKNDL